jgi:hypothetical protein
MMTANTTPLPKPHEHLMTFIKRLPKKHQANMKTPGKEAWKKYTRTISTPNPVSFA